MYNDKKRLESFPRVSLRKGRLSWWVVTTVTLLLPAQALAVDSALIRSLLIPGLGQAQKGQYTRAAVYAGTAVLSGFSLLLSHVYYNEAVDKYEAQRSIYLSYGDSLSAGSVVSIEEIRSTYEQMNSEYNSAENRLKWRNTFLIAFAATYAVNIVDVLISKPYDPDKAPPLSFEAGPGSFRVTKTFRF
jgi:hypothetical protein